MIIYARSPHARGRSLFIVALILSTLVTSLTATSIVSALPTIAGEFGVNQAESAWIVTAAVITATAGLGIWGTLSQGSDGRLLLIIALMIFLLTSSGLAVVTDWSATLALRAVQGVSIGGVQVLGQVVLAGVLGHRERGKYLGVFATATGVSTISGPSIGGYLTETFGWHSVFIAPIPICAAAVLLLLFLPRGSLSSAPRSSLLSAGMLGATSGGGLLVLEAFQGASGGALSTIGAAVGGVGLVLLLWLQHRSGWPVFGYRRSGVRGLSRIAGISLTTGSIFLATMVLLSQYYQISRGYSALQAGAALIPLIAGSFITASVLGWIAARTGRWKAGLLGSAALALAGVGVLVFALPAETDRLVFAGMSLLGIGLGGLSPQAHTLVAHHLGGGSLVSFGSSMIAFTRNLGSAIGLAVATIITSAVLRSRGIDETLPDPNGFADAIAVAFAAMLPVAVCTLALIASLPNKPLREE